MPYIITTGKRFDYADSGVGGVQVESRTAVATLEEARDLAKYKVRVDDPMSDDPPEYAAAERAALELSESGGTVGPLPDGTVIEVRPATEAEWRNHVRREADRRTSRWIGGCDNAVRA